MSRVSRLKPWNPATITIAPSSSASRSRTGVTSTMRAAPCVASVIMPAWLPVNERASWPMLLIAIASSAIEMRSPRGEQHVELARRRDRRDLVREVEQLVGRVAHRADGDDHVVARLAGLDDALGDALDALRVGDGRSAVLLHDQAHVVSQGWWQAPGCASGRRKHHHTAAGMRPRQCDGRVQRMPPARARRVASRVRACLRRSRCGRISTWRWSGRPPPSPAS